MTPMQTALGVSNADARAFVVRGARWKFVHFEGGFRPMLFDLRDDPHELTDLGADPAHEGVRDRMTAALNAFARRLSQQTTMSDAALAAKAGTARRNGILLGLWDESDVPQDLTSTIRPRPVPDMTGGT